MSSPDSEAPTSAPGAVTRVMKIVNEKGLHARASAKFVQLVEKFDATVRVSRNADGGAAFVRRTGRWKTRRV